MTINQLKIGDIVLVGSLAGVEVGSIESINLISNKVDIYFNDPACPHIDRFNFNQILEVIA